MFSIKTMIFVLLVAWVIAITLPILLKQFRKLFSKKGSNDEK